MHKNRRIVISTTKHSEYYFTDIILKIRKGIIMKKLLSFILCAVLAISATACSSKTRENKDPSFDNVLNAGKITVAISPDFAPSEFKNPETGEVLGSDVFVANYIADYLSEKHGKTIELVIEEMEFKSCIAAVQSGSVDFSVNGYAATEERKRNFICTSPYGMTESDSDSYQGLLIKESDYDNYHSAEDFSGKKIAVQNTSLQYNLVSEQLPQDIEVEFIGNVNMGANMLAEGKVDALATTSETAKILCLNFEGLKMADFKFDYTSTGTVALVNLENEALAAEISEAIEDMVANVNWEEVRAKYTDLANELGVKNG